MKTIKWTCPKCENVNEQETHSNPEAHFPSMICDECDYEIEDCLCDYENYDREYFREQGRKGAAKSHKTQFGGKSQAEISEMMRKRALMKKPKQG